MNHRTAFPIQSYTCAEKGMTMRDYFAAEAMQGFLTGNYDLYAYEVVQKAYEMADAMMKARGE